MARTRWIGLLLIVTLLAGVIPTGCVQAARGVPGSPEFGFGASLHVDGPYLDQAFLLAGSLRLDWLAIDLSWQSLEPQPAIKADWAAVDTAMRNASRQKIAVLVRLVEPPAWVLTDMGPNPEQVTRFVSAVAERYPGIVQAIELFPGANTQQGWGSQPDPFAYAALFTNTKEIADRHGVLLVAAGLRPIDSPTEGVDDLHFLQGLYDAGLQPSMPVIGLDLVGLSGDPLAPPDTNQTKTLRRYELVREVMLQNNHASGLLWITRLGIASGTIDSAASQTMNLEEQKAWLLQAAKQIRSQLYIGVTVFQSLNPARSEAASTGNSALILGNTAVHPFYPLLKAFIEQNCPQEPDGKPGRPKDIALIKAPDRDA